LNNVGTVAVLTGGSAATYYAPETYQSRDAHFVISLSADPAGAEAALRALGYQQLGGTYRHDSNAFTVEFPPGPLGIGDDLDVSYDTVRRGDELLYIISRTIACAIAWRRSTSSMIEVH
jgi:hypothetical protein